MPNESERPFAGLPEIQSKIRRAVEELNYSQVLVLVEEQQKMFRVAGREHPDVPHFARLAYELTTWALTMIRLQRAHTQSAIRRLTAQKRIAERYQTGDPVMQFGPGLGGAPLVACG